jgi:alkaline phosphatase
MVPVFAYGTGAEEFAGIYENTEIYRKMMKLLNLNE